MKIIVKGVIGKLKLSEEFCEGASSLGKFILNIYVTCLCLAKFENERVLLNL